MRSRPKPIAVRVDYDRNRRERVVAKGKGRLGGQDHRGQGHGIRSRRTRCWQAAL